MKKKIFYLKWYEIKEYICLFLQILIKKGFQYNYNTPLKNDRNEIIDKITLNFIKYDNTINNKQTKNIYCCYYLMI